NPFWVIALTPPIMAFFRWRDSLGRPITTARKMFYGLLFTMVSMLIMEFAAWMYELGHARVSSLWLVSAYGVVTFGEVCLTPMGQSMVMKLAPPRLVGILMGGWFCAIAIGNALSGLLGKVQHKV